MYTYTIPDEQTEQIAQKTKKYSDLLNTFKAVDEKYRPSQSELTLQRKTFEKPSDEQIEKQAKNSLEEYKQVGRQDIMDEYDKKSLDIDTKIENEKNSGDAQKLETKQMYESLKDSASKDAIKRGLARSSIAINILDAFDKDMVSQINKLNEQIQSKVTSLNGQKELYDKQRQSALNAFDISYALKLTEKIDSINKQLAEQEQKVIEYNNQIAEKEAEYEAKRSKNNLELATYLSKYGQEAYDNMKREEKFEYAKEYLLSLPKQEALAELETNTMLASELGAKYFNKLKLFVNSNKED